MIDRSVDFSISIMMASAAGSFTTLWTLLSVLVLTEGKEFTVTCTEECMLPCQFQSDGKGARIMWFKKKEVVSCTRYGDTHWVVGHSSASDTFKGRTDLYADQVLQGNATLLLRDVTPRDEGKYFCITFRAPGAGERDPRTEESGIITVNIRSPVKSIDMQMTGDIISCSSRKIFPPPKIMWSTDPPSDTQALQISTQTIKTPEGFYDITGQIVGNNTNVTYICTISDKSDTSVRRANLKKQASIQTYPDDSGVVIPCSFPDSALHSFNLTWSFRTAMNRTDEPILTVNVSGHMLSPVSVQERWKPHVSLGFLTFGHLQLHDLRSEHQGTYRCELITGEETYVTLTNVISNGDGRDDRFQYFIIIAVMAHFLLLAYASLAILGFKFHKQKKAISTAATTPGDSNEEIQIDDPK